MMNIGRPLNQRFECPACHASGSWRATTRARVREASTIQGFRCRHCSEKIVVKVPRATAGSDGHQELAQREYRVLCALRTEFPQDDQFGTLVPLGYLELDGYGAMITRKFAGVDLIRYVSRLNADQTQGLFRPAGLLLRKLHDSCPSGYHRQTLGVSSKAAYLTETYGTELGSDPVMRNIYDQFEQARARLGTLELRATWSHGDFKPENVLCDGHKYLILDTELEYRGAFVYDLASFLSNLLITVQSVRRWSLRRHYQRAEEEFLAGYGGVTRQELVALRWAQLYFMLHYWGKYRRGGRLSAIYANWRIRPLAQKLATKL